MGSVGVRAFSPDRSGYKLGATQIGVGIAIGIAIAMSKIDCDCDRDSDPDHEQIRACKCTDSTRAG